MTPRLQCPVTAPSPPLLVDLYCGLGGWTEGFLAEGYECIGFDIEQHVYGEHRYPAQLVLQDVCTLHGKQFKDATILVASSPCQEFSYRAMPWKRAKALGPPEFGMHLFAQARRIQLEASEAAGRYIPMIQENVRGAQPWVGRAQWHYGSYYLWGDVPALMPFTHRGVKIPLGQTTKGGDFNWRPGSQPENGTKNSGGSWFNVAHNTTSGRGQNPDGRKVGDSFGWSRDSDVRNNSSKSLARKAASARIAKIPYQLALHIARTFKPQPVEGVA